MIQPLYWVPLLRLPPTENAAWIPILGERFRRAQSGRGQVLVDQRQTAAAFGGAHFSSRRAAPPMRGWATLATANEFLAPYDIEIPVPDGQAIWQHILDLPVPPVHILLQRDPQDPLYRLSHALSLVPDSVGPWIDGQSWGWEASYWALGLHPQWNLYGSISIAFASTLADALRRPLWIIDFGPESAKSMASLPAFGRVQPDRATFRHDPAPTEWL